MEALFVGEEANETASLFFDEGKIAFCRDLLHDLTALGLLGFDVHQAMELPQLYLGFAILLQVVIFATSLLLLQISLNSLIANSTEIHRGLLEGHLILILERRDAWRCC